MRLGWIALATLALTACKAGPGDAPGSKAGDISESDARTVVEDLNKAFASGDSMQIMQHYAPGAVVLDAGHLQPTTDRQLQTQWTAQFATMHPSDFVTSDLHITPMGPDAFVATGLSSFTADVGQGRDVLHIRFTQAFRKQADGKFAIVAEHISMPPPGPGQ